MISAVVSSVVYIEARKAMEIFTPQMRKLWKDWELRVLVLLSLFLQILLIFFGRRRKYRNMVWLRFLLWSTYLMADWVATVALGVLLNNMGDVYENGGKAANLDADTQLTAFWAPFLLLHLGGPDTITAYSLEDNELWLRHFLGLGVQTGVAFYIFLLAWTASLFSILTMPMLLAGIIKYGERTWALRSASSEELRDSMLTAPDPGPNYSQFMEEFTLKQYEGFQTVAEEVLESQIQVDVSAMGDNTIKDAPELRIADYLFKTFKRLFVDLILSFQDRDNSQSLFRDISSERAFIVIEIELGFMYDMLFTKGKVIYSRTGCFLRFISLSSTCIVLVFFSLHKKHGCAKIDIAITFLLLIIAIFLEVWAILLVLSSDWTDLYLSKQKSRVIGRAIAYLKSLKRPRWSRSMAQYNLLSYSIKSKPVVHNKIQKLFSIDNIVEHLHMTTEEVEDDLENFIFSHLQKKFQKLKEEPDENYLKELKDLCTCRGTCAIKGTDHAEELRWSVEAEFDQSILIWHIATDLIYSSKENDENSTEPGEVKNDSVNSSEPGEVKKEILNSSEPGEMKNDNVNSSEPGEVKNDNVNRPGEVKNDNVNSSETGEVKSDNISSELGEVKNDNISLEPGQVKKGKNNSESGAMNSDKKSTQAKETNVDRRKICNALSKYMLYLLVMRPAMLPMGIGKIRYQDTCAEAMRIFQKHESILGTNRRSSNFFIWAIKELFIKGDSEVENSRNACNALLKVSTVVPPVKVKGDRSKSVLFDACRLASQLQKIPNKWELMGEVWVEMLAYAAGHCRGTYHAQQLGRGGELLTHVWFLMAHFGLTEQFQISQGHARAKLTVR